MAGSVGNQLLYEDKLIFLVDGFFNLDWCYNRINNTTGSFYNGVTYTTDRGMNFDGVNDYFEYNINMPASFTYTIVAKSNTPTWSNYAGLGSSRTSQGFIIHNNIGNTTITDYIYNTSTVTYAVSNYNVLNIANSIEDNNIYTLSTNQVTHTMYINGVKAGERTYPVTRLSTNMNIQFARDYNLARYNNINIKHLSMYNDKLTDDEVYTLHSNLRKRIPL